MSEFYLDVASASGVIATLVGAASRIATTSAPRPRGGFESLTGVEADVDLYLRGVSVARAALSDAAITSGQSIRDLLESTAKLDAELAASLNRDFALSE